MRTIAEALRLMAQVDQYARKMRRCPETDAGDQAACSSGRGSVLGSEPVSDRESFETDAIRLFEKKRFGEATGKFNEASEAYVRAEGDARTQGAELAREAAAREKAAKDE